VGGGGGGEWKGVRRDGVGKKWTKGRGGEGVVGGGK